MQKHLLSCVHFNCRSLAMNFQNLSTFVSELDLDFSTICLTETWLTSDSSHSNLDGYAFLANNRSTKRGGGVGMFINSNVSYKQRNDLTIMTESLESLFIEVSHFSNINKQCLVGVLYRPPGSSTIEFLDCLNTILYTINRERKTCFLLGDFNFDLLVVDTSNSVSDFFDCMMTYSMYPLIHVPTRITDTTATLLDNVFTNYNVNDCKSGVLIADVSDHLPVYVLTDISLKPTQTSNESFFFKRTITDINTYKFMNMLANMDFAINTGNVDSDYNVFMSKLSSTYNECFPLKKIHLRQHAKQPWYNAEIARMCSKKLKLYKKYLSKRTENSKRKYKIFRNKVTCAIRKAKHQYYNLKFQRARGNMKSTWKAINELLGKRAKAKVDFMDDNGFSLSDVDVAESFNDFFVNIAPKLISNLPPNTDVQYEPVNTPHNANSFFCRPITNNEIIKIVCNMKNKTSTGVDELDITVIKKTIHLLCDPLCVIFNASLQSGTVPNQMKIAKVIPIFKTGDTCSFSNYRPISILPLFSKILERCMYNRLSEFINIHNLLYYNQFGFRAQHSTSSALIEYVHTISRAIDDKKIAISLFLDLSKAFDCLDHHILLSKLYNYGIRGVAYDWFKDYLSNRKQYTFYNNSSSQLKELICGVPQGSILGPLLFLLYIDDIRFVSNKINFILFADDTTVTMSHSDLNVLVDTLNNELIKVQSWLRINKLILNTSKTHMMIFTKRNVDVSNVHISLGGTIIEQVPNTKFLGINIDNKLSWNSHINAVSKIVSKNVGVLNRLNFLPQHILLNLYYTLIYPHLSYCNVVWASPNNSAIIRLHRLQKRAIRAMCNLHYNAPTGDFFINLKIVNVYSLYKLNLATLMFSCHKGLLPDSLMRYFSLNDNTHTHFTRQSHDFHIPYTRTTLSQKSVDFSGPKLWNSLPASLKDATSLKTFKRIYREILLFNG